MSNATFQPFSLSAGVIGFGIGAIGLMLVLVQFYAGPFAPQQSVGVVLGELAAEIRLSATNALEGRENPAAVASDWDIDRIMAAAAAVAAGLAIFLGLAGLIRGESRKPAAYAITLGVGAILFQLVAWAILLVAGVLLIIGVMDNIGDILGG